MSGYRSLAAGASGLQIDRSHACQMAVMTVNAGRSDTISFVASVANIF